MTTFNWRKWVSPSRGGSFIAALLIAAFLMLPTSAFAVRAKFLAFYGTANSDWAIVEIPDAGPLKWKILKNPSSPAPGAAQISIFDWGVTPTDATPTSFLSISPGSFDGNTTFDPNVARVGTAGTPIVNWTYPYPSSPGGVQTPWGVSGGAPADNLGRNGDYDGDGIVDFTTLRISGGQVTWFIRPSTSPGTMRVVNFGTTATGQSLFAFEGADFTGDGRDELVLARVVQSSGLTIWYIGDAVTGQQVNQIIFGDWDIDFITNPADYTGDGKADLCVFRAGASNPAQWQFWRYNPATNQTLPPYTFGIGDPNFVNYDIPVRGDYDGDGIFDLCVWRPSNGVFYAIRSSDGAFVVQPWGVGGASPDFPIGGIWAF